MKLLLIGTFFLLVMQSSFCQKHDNSWQFGFGNQVKPGVQMEFIDDSLSLSLIERELTFHHTTGSICDSLGNLQFYTNGCKIFHFGHDVMEGGESIGGGDELYDFMCSPSSGMRYQQGSLILPAGDSRYQLFHQNSMQDDYTGNPYTDVVYRSVVHMALNDGFGQVMSSNEIVLEDEILFGNFNAVRHGNGLNWWMVLHRIESDIYHVFLVDSSGVIDQKQQAIGRRTRNENQTIGQAKFSPDGNKFLYYDLITGLQIFDFDRGTGTLSNPIRIKLWRSPAQGVKVGGMAISPNSRYVYACNGDYLDQFDLWADDIEASRTFIQKYDGFADPFSTNFFQMQLGPDGKIYMCIPNGMPYLHVINAPDSQGVACDFVQRGVVLPADNVFSMPYFPNYRLGADSSLLTSTHNIHLVDQHDLNLYPNPVMNSLQIDNAVSYKSYMIFNQSGKLCAKGNVTNNTIKTTGLTAGLYHLQLQSISNILFNSKFIKL